MKKRLVILGATGSIGSNTMDIVRSNPSDFEIVAMSSHENVDALLRLGKDFPQAVLALTGIAQSHNVELVGPEAAMEVIRATNPDIVVNGIAGAAGLMPSLETLRCGADLALANKETIVMAGPLILSLAEKQGTRVIPVDSEHSAIFHLLEAHGHQDVEELVLTASGGPFRGWPKDRLVSVDASAALAHPTWKMGGKISIDSATLANKGLEVIEAVRLFGFSADRVQVLVHPQSKVHSLIRLTDGSLYAQISNPDMRVPIQNALYWPDCHRCDFGRLDLAEVTLSFEKPDTNAFPMLPLAYVAARLGNLYPTAYNAANEIAVAAFRAGTIGFLDIPRVTHDVLDTDWTEKDDSIDSILEGDRRARIFAERIIAEAIS